MSGQNLLTLIVVGVVAGWLAGQLVLGTGLGIVGDLVVGIAGAFIGNYLMPQLGIHIGAGLVSAIVDAAVGAVILLLLIRLVSGGAGSGGRWGFGRRW